MADHKETEDRGEAATAFDSVLAAERAAAEAIAACREEAAQRLATAHERAQALAAKTEARAQAWRIRSAARIADEVGKIDQRAAQAAGPVALDASMRARIAAAVARLADELTGQ